MTVGLTIGAVWGREWLVPGEGVWLVHKRFYGSDPGPFQHRVVGVPEPYQAGDPQAVNPLEGRFDPPQPKVAFWVDEIPNLHRSGAA